MKKLFSFFFIVTIIFTVFITGLFVIVKNEARSEKIIERLEQFANDNNIYLILNDIKYNLSIYGIKIVLYDVSIKSDNIESIIEKIKLEIDLKSLIKKELNFTNIEIINSKTMIISFETNNNESPSQNKYNLTSLIKIKNAEIVYDTFQINNLCGKVFFSSDSILNMFGNINFNSNNHYIKKFNIIKERFNISFYEDTLIINNLNIRGDNIFSFNIKGKFFNKIFYYDINGFISDLSVIDKYNFSPYINIKGNTSFILSGNFNSDTILLANLLYINKFQLKCDSMFVVYDSLNIKSMHKLIVEKSDSLFIVNGNVFIDSFNNTYKSSININELMNNNLDFQITIDSIETALSKYFLMDKKIKFKGKMKSSISLKIPFDSLSNFNYIKNNIYGNVEFDSMNVIYDTFNVKCKKGNFDLIKSKANGEISILYIGTEILDKFDLDIANKRISNNIYSITNIHKFNNEFYGTIFANGKIIYLLDKDLLSGTVKIEMKDIVYSPLKDTFDILIKKLIIENIKEFYSAKITINSKFVNADLFNINYIRNENENFRGKLHIKSINVDSLFQQDTSQQSTEKQNIHFNIAENLYTNFSTKADTVFLKNEVIYNTSFLLLLKNKMVYIDSIKGNALNGTIKGDVQFNSRNDFININMVTKGLKIHNFVKKHKLFPYNIGAEIDSRTKLNFDINLLKNSIKGKISIISKNGWMESPKLLSNISEIIRLPLSDTFYFDNMIGEFDIKDSAAIFDNFLMEKNGHSLLYSGKIDFNKNISIKGIYTINMQIADIGMLENLLRGANYNKDSIIVKFYIKGNYKFPNITIKYNSISEFLKNKTQKFIDNFIDDLNRLF